MNDEEVRSGFDEWLVLELMGHRRIAGHVTEQEVAGRGFLRIEIPADDGTTFATQFYSPTAVYGFTPVSEETARAFAKGHRPRPVTRFDLPAIETSATGVGNEFGDDED